MAAYRQIILHVGLSKTGSTSIQANCFRHRGTLHALGFHYPRFELAGQVFANHGIPLALAFSDNPSRYAMGLRRLFGDGVGAAAAHCRQAFEALLAAGGDTLLLSSERTAGFCEQDMVTLREVLRRHTGRLRVLVYVRSPFELLESILQERAKAGAVVDPLAVPGRAKTRYQNLQRVFSSCLETASFHGARMAAGGLVGDFLARCGVSEQDKAALEFTVDNRRISMEAFELMDAVNRRYPGNRRGEHGVPRRPGDLRMLEALPGEPFGFPWAAQPAVFEAVLAEYRWFESELGLQFPPPPAGSGAPGWTRETLEAVNSILPDIENPSLREFLTGYLRDRAAS